MNRRIILNVLLSFMAIGLTFAEDEMIDPPLVPVSPEIMAQGAAFITNRLFQAMGEDESEAPTDFVDYEITSGELGFGFSDSVAFIGGISLPVNLFGIRFILGADLRLMIRVLAPLDRTAAFDILNDIRTGGDPLAALNSVDAMNGFGLCIDLGVIDAA